MGEVFILPNGAKVTCSGDQAALYRAKGWEAKKPATPKKPKSEPKSKQAE